MIVYCKIDQVVAFPIDVTIQKYELINFQHMQLEIHNSNYV